MSSIFNTVTICIYRNVLLKPYISTLSYASCYTDLVRINGLKSDFKKKDRVLGCIVCLSDPLMISA